MFDAWSFFCFKIAGFEIVRTATMGLGKLFYYIFVIQCCTLERTYGYIMLVGIRATQRISMQSLSSKIAGFLEFIPRAHFKHLQKLHLLQVSLFV